MSLLPTLGETGGGVGEPLILLVGITRSCLYYRTTKTLCPEIFLFFIFLHFISPLIFLFLFFGLKSPFSLFGGLKEDSSLSKGLFAPKAPIIDQLKDAILKN